MKKTYVLWLLFVTLFVTSNLFALEISHSPEVLYTSGIITLRFQNNAEQEKKVTLISYILEDGEKKYYTKDSYTIKPFQSYEIKRIVNVNEKTESVYFIIYGDVYREIFIPIVKIENQNIVEHSITTSDERIETNIVSQVEFTKSSISQEDSCNSYVLHSLDSGPGYVFYEDERILLNVVSDYKPIFLSNNFLFKEIAPNIYEITPLVKKPGKYEVTFYLENCGTQTITFEIIPKPIDINALIFFIFLAAILIFFAVMVDLSILDSKRMKEREERKKRIMKKISPENIKKR